MRKVYILFFFIFIYKSSAQFTQIPDANFEQELINQGIDNNPFIDGQVLTSAISNIISLTMNSPTASNIINLSGIEDFTLLEDLSFASAGSLQYINTSQNQYLKKIFLVNAQISNLNISNNLALETLYLYYTSQLNTVDLSSNINLKDIAIGDFNLTQLNLSNNLNLVKLRISNTQINQLDIAYNLGLKYFFCGINPITTIDVSHNLLLEELRVFSCQITSLDISQNVNLKVLGTSNNTIQNIDLSLNQQLEDLYCINNQLTDLNLNNNTLLNKVLCNNYNGFPQNNITLLYIQNGANSLLNGVYDATFGSITPVYKNRFDSTGNPNLHCIFVNEVTNCNTNWLGKDVTSNYVSTQQECNNLSTETFTINNEITIYPNPVNDIFFISSNNNNTIQKIAVYDLMGKTVIKQNGNSTEINISNISNGMYLVKITTEKETILKKIIKK